MRRLALVLAALVPGAALAAQTPAPSPALTPKATEQPAKDQAGKPPMRELPSPYTPNYTGGALPRGGGQPDFAYGAYQKGQYVTAFR